MGNSAKQLGCLLTLEQAAEILNCSLKTVQRRIESGDLPVIRDGRLVRVHPDDLDRFIRLRREG
ncbi:helix-turn-helix domain-containing protein [Tropicimonas marinistellae]|uniref:helix-turn-helix domain-containing protein n=1 Tax=Tropicimonas marinistellae TaxID=1739787 RepID=UPI00083507AD|nr:helix-turn-helix domain-containing protein [Tropicimonas marinistellae]